MSENANKGLGNHQSQSQAYLGGKENNGNLIDKGIQPLCDALKCNNRATEKIELSAGNYGILLINVCKNCIHKTSCVISGV
ncbi:MAG: hypothetical protein L0H53_13050 [Candidatus Nitrosocosmicus sp.]|nr:hypothetical protein [Candidatus Nitrosocosmicus sp.]MDN5868012.1 hypothetical protein [Candidatus Nitrosocosmicus sp.]